MAIKTARRRATPAVEAAIRARHPYELPEILAVPVADGFAPLPRLDRRRDHAAESLRAPHPRPPRGRRRARSRSSGPPRSPRSLHVGRPRAEVKLLPGRSRRSALRRAALDDRDASRRASPSPTATTSTATSSRFTVEPADRAASRAGAAARQGQGRRVLRQGRDLSRAGLVVALPLRARRAPGSRSRVRRRVAGLRRRRRVLPAAAAAASPSRCPARRQARGPLVEAAPAKKRWFN